MGWASLLAGSVKNPFTSWLGDNANMLRGTGVGIASGADLNTGFANAARYAADGAQKDDAYAVTQKAEAARQEGINKTIEMLRARGLTDLADMAAIPGADMGQIYNAALDRIKPNAGPTPTSDIQNYLFAQDNPGFADYQTQKGGAAEVALQPTWLQDGQGNWVLGQLAKDGSVVQTKLPPGMSPASPGELSGDRASGTVDAKTAGAARAALPGAQQVMKITADSITELRRNAAGMKEWFGQVGALPRGMVVQGGTEMGNFVAATKQANAEAFMQARDMLKGGGQITDYEGRRGEDAFSRMQAALDTGDQQAYLRALSDFESAVADGYAKLEATAQGGYSAGSLAVTGQGGNKTSSGVSWSVEP